MVGQSESLPMMMPTSGIGFFTLLPVQLAREEFSDQILVTRTQLADVGFLVVLCVKIVRIESPHPLEHLLVLFIHEMAVLSLLMRRIEGVIAQHIKSLLGHVIFGDLIDIFIM